MCPRGLFGPPAVTLTKWLEFTKRLLLRCIHRLKSDLINNMDYMRISGTQKFENQWKTQNHYQKLRLHTDCRLTKFGQVILELHLYTKNITYIRVPNFPMERKLNYFVHFIGPTITIIHDQLYWKVETCMIL